MIKKLPSKMQIIIIFAIFERIKGATEIELILSRLNKIENNQKLIIGTIRKQRGQIQQLDAALNIKQVNTYMYSNVRYQFTVVEAVMFVLFNREASEVVLKCRACLVDVVTDSLFQEWKRYRNESD